MGNDHCGATHRSDADLLSVRDAVCTGEQLYS
jgi:hypothetical protein